MKQKIIIALILILIPLTMLGNTVIAKERALSNGLYIIGPDISPDSTEHLFLYYSPDGGHTLEVRNRLDWIDFRDFAVDFADDSLYMLENTRLFVSEDCGRTFFFRSMDFGGLNIRSGTRRAMCITSGGLTSFDFAGSWIIPDGHGWFGTARTFAAEIGVEFGIGYIPNDDGILFFTDCHFDTLNPIYDFSTPVHIFRGVQAGELYAEKADSIFYSVNHGNSFEYVGIRPPATEYSKHEIIAGNTTGELFAATYYRNWIEGEYIYKGGHLEIWHSLDHGETWDLVRSHHAAVHEARIYEENQELFYRRYGDQIVTNGTTYLFDINGKLLAKGVHYDLSNLRQGLFVLTNGEKSNKIINIK